MLPQRAEATGELAQRSGACPGGMPCGTERDRQRRRRKQGDRRDGEGDLQATEHEHQRCDGRPDEHPQRLTAAHHGVARHELLRRASQPGKQRERRRALHDREETLDHRGDEDERRRSIEHEHRGGREDDERPHGVDAGEDGRRREAIGERRGERRPDDRRQHPQRGDESRRGDSSHVIGEHEQRDEVRPLGRDGQEPCRLDARHRAVAEDVANRGEQTGRVHRCLRV